MQKVCYIDFPEQKYQFKNDGSYPVISDDDACLNLIEQYLPNVIPYLGEQLYS